MVAAGADRATLTVGEIVAEAERLATSPSTHARYVVTCTVCPEADRVRVTVREDAERLRLALDAADADPSVVFLSLHGLAAAVSEPQRRQLRSGLRRA